jgi:hypothetical protein
MPAGVEARLTTARAFGRLTGPKTGKIANGKTFILPSLLCGSSLVLSNHDE